MLQITVGTVGETFLPASSGIELDEVASDVLDALLCLLLQPVPGSRAQGGEAWRLAGVAAAVLADLIEGVDGHVHLVVVLVDDAYHLLVTVARWHAHQSAKLTYSVIDMHNEVARLHLL